MVLDHGTKRSQKIAIPNADKKLMAQIPIKIVQMLKILPRNLKGFAGFDMCPLRPTYYRVIATEKY